MATFSLLTGDFLASDVPICIQYLVATAPPAVHRKEAGIRSRGKLSNKNNENLYGGQ